MSRRPAPAKISRWAEGDLSAIPYTTAHQRRRAARRLATEATSATDAAQLLAMLGLTPQDGLRPTGGQPGPAPHDSV